MQVFGLPGHIIRSGKWASRIAAKSPDNDAAIRTAMVRRWRQAIAAGLTAVEAAQAVCIARAKPKMRYFHGFTNQHRNAWAILGPSEVINVPSHFFFGRSS